MLSFNPSSLRVSTGDAVANLPSAAPAPNGSADPAGFASLLRQTQATPQQIPKATPPTPSAAPAPQPSGEQEASTPPTASKEATDEAHAPQESDSTSRARAVQKARLRAADGTAVSGQDGKPTLASPDTQNPVPTDKPASGDCLAPDTKATAANASPDPSVMQWLADLQRAAGLADSPKGGATGQAVGDTAGGADTALTDAAGASRNARVADLKADAALKEQLASGNAQAADAANLVATSPFAAALQEQGTVEKPLFKALDNSKEIAAIGASAAPPAPAAGTGAAAPAAVAIATPVNAPDFAQELGLRLSVLAKDGVQTAELHLNPADMGPVSVQIVMDGTQARVDFGADMAATRHAIEAGLPELASALADAGFTLAGGGVSQHAGGRSGGGGSDASGTDNPRRIATEDQVKRVASAARRVVTQGGVDLFA